MFDAANILLCFSFHYPFKKFAGRERRGAALVWNILGVLLWQHSPFPQHLLCYLFSELNFIFTGERPKFALILDNFFNGTIQQCEFRKWLERKTAYVLACWGIIAFHKKESIKNNLNNKLPRKIY